MSTRGNRTDPAHDSPRVSRLALPATATTMALAMGLSTFPTPLYPSYERAFGIGAFGVTLVFAGFALGAVVGLVIVQRRNGTIRPETLIAAAGTCTVIAAGILASTDSLPWFTIARILSGLGAGAAAAVATAAILAAASSTTGILAAAMVRLAPALSMFGLALGPALAGALVAAGMPPSMAYWLIAAAATITTTGVLLARRGTAPHTRAEPPARVAATDRATALIGFATTGMFGALTATIVHDVDASPSVIALGAAAALPFCAAAIGALSRSKRLVPSAALVAAGGALLLVALATKSVPLLVPAVAIAGYGAGRLFKTSLSRALAHSPHAPRTTTAVLLRWAYIGLAVPVIGLGLVTQVADVLTAVASYVALLIVALAFVVAAEAIGDNRRAASTRLRTPTEETP